MLCSPKMALFVAACVGLGKDVVAAEWALKGSLGQQLQYNDNIALTATQKDSVIGYLLTPMLQATRKTEVLDIMLEGQGDIRRYDNTRWDCESYNLGSNNGYRIKQSVFGLNGGYSVSCSYAQQITDTGLLVPSSQSQSYRLAPSWTWQWTSRDQLVLDALYSKTSYSNSVGGVASNNNHNSFTFSGNDTYTVNLGGNHIWNRRLSLNEKVYFSNIQYTGFNATTQHLFGFQLGASYEINHYWSVIASGGPRWVEGSRQPFDGGSSGQNSFLSLGPVANISLSYDDRLNKFSTGYSNASNPSAIGQTLQTESIFANYSYRFTEHLLLDLSSSYSKSQSIGDQSANSSNNQFNRRYFTASAGFGWQFAKNWWLKSSYVYRQQDYQQDKNVQNLNPGKSDSNAVMLMLNYSWDGIRSSR